MFMHFISFLLFTSAFLVVLLLVNNNNAGKLWKYVFALFYWQLCCVLELKIMSVNLMENVF